MTISGGEQPQTEGRVSHAVVNLLILNSGSSSLKFSVFRAEGGSLVSLFEGEVSGIGAAGAKVAFHDAGGRDLAPEPPKIGSMAEAIDFVARVASGPDVPKLDAVGYRVVHPGALLHGHQRITDAVLDDLRQAAAFAPLHDPAVVELIETMRRRFPELGHYACFDTVFHETMPPEATAYPLPEEFAERGMRRYGFHGLSCESIVVQLREAELPFPRRLAIAHLGGGCSVTALLDGKSVDTSMGLTPTGGIVMATRPGDLDPGLMLYLVRQGKIGDIEAMLNHKAGLAAFSNDAGGDMRKLRAAAEKGDARAALGLQVFTRSVTKALGGYLALLGGLDAIVFAGGIGEHDPASRGEILASLQPLGIQLDAHRNGEKGAGLRRISTEGSATHIYIVPAEEDRMIARLVADMAQAQP